MQRSTFLIVEYLQHFTSATKAFFFPINTSKWSYRRKHTTDGLKMLFMALRVKTAFAFSDIGGLIRQIFTGFVELGGNAENNSLEETFS